VYPRIRFNARYGREGGSKEEDGKGRQGHEAGHQEGQEEQEGRQGVGPALPARLSAAVAKADTTKCYETTSAWKYVIASRYVAAVSRRTSLSAMVRMLRSNFTTSRPMITFRP